MAASPATMSRWSIETPVDRHRGGRAVAMVIDGKRNALSCGRLLQDAGRPLLETMTLRRFAVWVNDEDPTRGNTVTEPRPFGPIRIRAKEERVGSRGFGCGIGPRRQEETA